MGNPCTSCQTVDPEDEGLILRNQQFSTKKKFSRARNSVYKNPHLGDPAYTKHFPTERRVDMVQNMLEHVSLMVIRQFNKIGPIDYSKQNISKSEIIELKKYFKAEAFEIDGEVYKG